MTLKLSNKVALITNAASSFGYTVAQKLGNLGAKIFISDPDPIGLKYTLEGLKGANVESFGILTDLSLEKDRNQLFETIRKEAGLLDIAVLGHKPNLIKGDIISNTFEEFDQVYSKYLTIPFFTCKEALPLLEKSKNGASIILVSSIAGFTPFADIGLYSSAQTGVLGLCKALAQNLAHRRIRVNSVCMGMFEDDGTGAIWSSCSSGAKNTTSQEVNHIRNALVDLIPMGRLARATDCTGLIEFLASAHSSYITGENIPLNGGISIRI